MDDEQHHLKASDFSGKGFTITLGRFFFKNRDGIAAPLFILMLVLSLWKYENNLIIWTIGPALICAGEACRLWAMRHIGRSARTQKEKARKLVTTGPYAFSRNPLYIGNHLILFGFCVLSKLLWFIPVALGICFAFYSFIIIYEEELLKQRFQEDYLKYKSETPRWISLSHILTISQPEWLEAVYRERKTIYGLIIGIIVFGLKQIASHYL